jgi:hypothetical protein
MGYLAEWQMVLRVWLAGAAAWLITQLLPLGLKLLDDQRMSLYRARLAMRRSALVEEWGLEDDRQS